MGVRGEEGGAAQSYLREDPSRSGDYRGAVQITRYRCTACGNLTRFDVTTTRTTRAFHHYSVGGELQVEEVEVRAESVDDVSCRWCGHGRSVEALTGEVEFPDDVPREDVNATADGDSGAPSPVR